MYAMSENVYNIPKYRTLPGNSIQCNYMKEYA